MEGAKIIIVGGSSGMGLALAARLLEEGASVTIAGRSADRLAAARRDLGDHPGLATLAVDISREEEVAALFRNSDPVDHIVST
ncbi:SDR family NAD(P)-dependent oxidoreductase, partial [Mesorhizobium sp. M1A.T.Ca.IN.004.03.1.1]|uniref:SDR family NAD(P)-dependent oxidoreductase n=1 Tax=Mesorhizobium sp. M1A.T.Ca.IN.004.03.1.1 TaxID=2496795 RepID=UPI001FE23F64